MKVDGPRLRLVRDEEDVPPVVNEPLTRKRRAAARVGHSDYQSLAERIGRRVADCDPEALVELVMVRDSFDTAIATAVSGLRKAGFSWAAISAPMGISRQAAQQRWG